MSVLFRQDEPMQRLVEFTLNGRVFTFPASVELRQVPEMHREDVVTWLGKSLTLEISEAFRQLDPMQRELFEALRQTEPTHN